jgi:hypothetical protein
MKTYKTTNLCLSDCLSVSLLVFLKTFSVSRKYETHTVPYFVAKGYVMRYVIS